MGDLRSLALLCFGALCFVSCTASNAREDGPKFYYKSGVTESRFNLSQPNPSQVQGKEIVISNCSFFHSPNALIGEIQAVHHVNACADSNAKIVSHVRLDLRVDHIIKGTAYKQGETVSVAIPYEWQEGSPVVGEQFLVGLYPVAGHEIAIPHLFATQDPDKHHARHDNPKIRVELEPMLSKMKQVVSGLSAVECGKSRSTLMTTARIQQLVKFSMDNDYRCD